MAVEPELRAAIERGELAPGSPLPTSTDLAAQHNVSSGTVNRAIALLKESGLVVASRGKRATVITTH
jgi:integrase